MNAKQAVSEIKAILGQFGLMSAPKASFKTEDNTIYQAEKIEAGYALERMNDKFEFEAVEDGVYKTTEGKNVEVKDSKIVAVKEAFLDAKLIDGTQVKVEGEELLPGAKVIVVTAEAEVPAPDGVHELEDGTKVETKDGAIVSVKAPEAKVDMQESIPGDIQEEEDAADTVGLDPEMIEFVQMMKKFVKKMDEKMGMVEKKMESIETQFSAFKKEPAARKIADGKTDFNKINQVSDIDSIAENVMKLRQLKK